MASSTVTFADRAERITREVGCRSFASTLAWVTRGISVMPPQDGGLHGNGDVHSVVVQLAAMRLLVGLEVTSCRAPTPAGACFSALPTRHADDELCPVPPGYTGDARTWTTVVSRLAAATMGLVTASKARGLQTFPALVAHRWFSALHVEEPPSTAKVADGRVAPGDPEKGDDAPILRWFRTEAFAYEAVLSQLSGRAPLPLALYGAEAFVSVAVEIVLENFAKHGSSAADEQMLGERDETAWFEQRGRGEPAASRLARLVSTIAAVPANDVGAKMRKCAAVDRGSLLEMLVDTSLLLLAANARTNATESGGVDASHVWFTVCPLAGAVAAALAACVVATLATNEAEVDVAELVVLASCKNSQPQSNAAVVDALLRAASEIAPPLATPFFERPEVGIAMAGLYAGDGASTHDVLVTEARRLLIVEGSATGTAVPSDCGAIAKPSIKAPFLLWQRYVEEISLTADFAKRGADPH